MQPRFAPRLGKEGASSHRAVIVWLFGAIFCFQVVYHVMMHSALLREEASDLCGDALGFDKSPQCMEAKLFHSWKAATLELEQTMEHAFASDTDEDLEHFFPVDADGENASQFSPANDTHAMSKPQDAVSMMPSMQPVAWPSTQASTQNEVSDASFHARAISTPSMLPRSRYEKNKKVEHSEGKLSEIKNTVSPVANSRQIVLNNSKPVAWGNMTPWVQSLIDLQALWEHRMQKRREERHGAAATMPSTPAPSSTTQWSNMTAWAKDLAALQARLESQMNRLPHRAYRTPKTVVPQEHEETLLELIVEFGRELCLEPRRRGRASCAQFVQSIQQPKGRLNPKGGGSRKIVHELHESGHDVNDDSFAHRAMALGKELCMDPRRKAYDACKRFRQDHVEGTNNALEGMKPHQQSGELSWRKAAGWRSALRTRRQVQILSGSELRHAHWSGMIPKVACITVLPCGEPLHPRLRYFINNFRLQSYEGPRQLILVYHHTNLEAARLVRLYADGVFIEGIAVFGTEYPSAASFRFGAWESDADVVARWDFDAWHHTQRLSMQVRALSLSGRPACFLRQWSVRSEAGDIHIVSDGSRWDASLVGEASWMRDKWYPLLEEFQMAVESGKERQVVYVDLSELTIYPEGLGRGGHNRSAGTDVVAGGSAAAQPSGVHGGFVAHVWQ